MNDEKVEKRKVIYCPSWDYLTIAQRYVDQYKDKDQYNEKCNINHSVEPDALISIIFSWLAVEARLNDIWLAEYNKRSNTNLKSCDWCKINEPQKWRRLPLYDRLDLLNLSVNSRNFFESNDPYYCRDLFKDFVDLRNCIIHSVPDIMIEEKQILLRKTLNNGMIYTESKTIFEGRIEPIGRKRNKNLSIKMSQWNDIKDVNKEHALESFKITLAVLYKISKEFKVPSSGNGIFINSRLTDFKNAYLYYENLEKSHFYDVVKAFFLD